MPDPKALREWHPLDYTPAEYIPPRWIGTHVGKRLAEALRTLRYMPINGYPRAFGNAWPRYQSEWSDALAQFEADEAQQEQEARAKNWTRIIPSAAEIARMEIAIIWPARYPQSPPAAPAHRASRGGCAPAIVTSRAARKLGLPGRLARRWNNEGLDLIAAGLRRDAVAVF
jgi:hypothetical protein